MGGIIHTVGKNRREGSIGALLFQARSRRPARAKGGHLARGVVGHPSSAGQEDLVYVLHVQALAAVRAAALRLDAGHDARVAEDVPGYEGGSRGRRCV